MDTRQADVELSTPAQTTPTVPAPLAVVPIEPLPEQLLLEESRYIESGLAVADSVASQAAESSEPVDEADFDMPSAFEDAMQVNTDVSEPTETSALSSLSMEPELPGPHSGAPRSGLDELNPTSLTAPALTESAPRATEAVEVLQPSSVEDPAPEAMEDGDTSHTSLPAEATACTESMGGLKMNDSSEPLLSQHEDYMELDAVDSKPLGAGKAESTGGAPLAVTLETQAHPQLLSDSTLPNDLVARRPGGSHSPGTETTALEPGFIKSEATEQESQETQDSDAGPVGLRPQEEAASTDNLAPAANAGEVRGISEVATAEESSDSELTELTSTDVSNTAQPDPAPTKSALSHLIGESRSSFASSASALTERSGLSSKPPSVSSKATTPLDTGSPRESLHIFTPVSTFQPRSAPRKQFRVRPKVSVPTDLTPQEYAMECIEAAENSRLNPYALHQEEYLMLRQHISHAQVTTYLNIRNGILRLWVRNPQIAVTREEAIGCAKDTRWFDVANICFDWLVRRGYINYGCVEIRQQKNSATNSEQRRRRTIVVIGAGFAGLGCARQLEGLFLQYSKRFRDMGEDPPRVVMLEGRSRVGGRVYSRAFQTLPDTAPGVFRGKRFTAEMGGMIITGFERGNPLNILVRGQLGLPYHCLRSDMSLYDTNGTAVDPLRDQLVEHLFNACLDRVSEFKFKPPPSKLIEGNRDLMDEGRDSSAEGHKTIASVEEATAAQPHAPTVAEQNVAPQVNLVPVSTDRMTGKVHVEPGTPGSTKAAVKAKSLGWTLKAGVSDTKDIELNAAANDPKATLGSVVDDALMQHKDILDLSAQDFRLLNWHIANLEYSNATNLNRLSIKGWDIDAGNEWEGKHTMVVGGYQSVARGIAMLPAPLDIKHRAAVKRIKYVAESSTGPARIDLENGQSIQADCVVNTIPLGVLKHGNIEFQPPLPPWKTEAIQRLGFGVLNKVILVYKEAFWDKERDIFGMLQTPTNRLSLNQKDYASRRGRFFQWFNVTNTTGMPCLLALMAGDAGYDTEVTPNDELIAEATEVLRMRYGARVTQPLEAIVTRWESDRYARGSYSNAGVNMKAEDYQLMGRSIGNLHFAGEHTTVTHPATVHGAYLSGLRAASDVLDSILGPIEIPTPLVLPRETAASLKRKAQEENKDPARARLEAYEMEITEYIHSRIGYYPLKPAKMPGNPYLLFNKAHYEEGRRRCEEGRRAGKGKPGPNEVRTMTSKMWKEAAPEVRKPYEDQAEEQKRAHAQALQDWTEAAAQWEREAAALRERYIKEHPSAPGPEELAVGGGALSANGARRAKRIESYAEDESDLDL